ncbi:Ser-Thr-rich glycosyl-phosphatidyl-inositol-anchored membrane family-domain-containing protein [Talaromyces proteolyticus]|uniref:Ser-Thr-rich glycosyl-phosphatidyl-inositol-anchored membrane family-domain-containing protein n=1 Tax=Talaromyces proteolyticus TaxID=1131652 RepID=A0AAD4KW65_9EURO|nr:Ser-Thr-rich glycosyl-phosphatidyl-inositol-anchored membrane family-domain-containing protein [Talaromyces proteolyticus]KAH8701116.1 Ser-Thr-rich glycosyl-phosphatidyl-inositol-anchored membrane family-domain-containing protein [Talaromyces proteolyticus]
MRFLTLATGLFAAIAAAASSSSTDTGANAFIAPVAGTTLKAGQTTTLKWTPTTSGTVNLRLQWGALTTADEGLAIASAISNTGSFSWTPPSSIPVESDYFIRIASDSDASEVNYSARFAISGVSGSVSISASTSFSTTVSSTSTSATSTTLVTSTSTSTTTSASSTSTSKSTSTSTSTSATPTSTVLSSTSAVSSARAASTTTTAAATTTAATTPTSVPHTNGVESIKVPGCLIAAVALGAFALL